MTSKRILATAAIVTALGATLLTGCAPTEPDSTASPVPTTQSSTPTPTPTRLDAPQSEEEAIEHAKAAIANILTVQGTINAAGGVDATPYNDLATGKGLEVYLDDANRIAHGPLANEDAENVEGQAKTEGALKFEVQTAYGQEFNGIPNGLVIVPGCMDGTDYKITTADGKPAYRPESVRTKVEFQVTYDAERGAWLIYNQIGFVGETC